MQREVAQMEDEKQAETYKNTLEQIKQRIANRLFSDKCYFKDIHAIKWFKLHK